MTLLANALIGLRQRIVHLQDDLNDWRELTQAGSQLQQHNSQVTRMTRVLEGTIQDSITGTPIDPNANLDTGELSHLKDYRRTVGSIHLIWEYFRDKLAQRSVTRFRDHLNAADDLAWDCYRPFLDAAVASGSVAVEQVKEPPLVFYDYFRVPFAQARTKTFSPAGLDENDIEIFNEVLGELPIPVIGVPWEDILRLPSLVALCHEVGHIVAEDLGLAAEAKQLLSAIDYPGDIDGDRRSAWTAWSDEVFGDVFGVTACGRSFAVGLGTELADEKEKIRKMPINTLRPGRYPTPTLRMAICEALLRMQGIDPFSDWSDVYLNLTGNSYSFMHDIEPLVEALFDYRWSVLGQRTLRELLPWDATHEEHARSVAESALLNASPAVAYSSRVWIAGSMQAVRMDPIKYVQDKLDDRLAKSIAENRTVGLRSAHARQLRSEMLEGVTESADQVRMNMLDMEIGVSISRKLRLSRDS